MKPTFLLDSLPVVSEILNRRAFPKPDSRFTPLHKTIEILNAEE